MNNPVYQHYIPRSYLKNFGIPKGRVVLVDTIMRGKEEVVKVLPTQAICAEKNIYTFGTNQPGDPYALEKFYAREVDAVYPKVYNTLVNSQVINITPEVKREILNTLLSLKFRRPMPLQGSIARLEEMFERMSARSSDPEVVITYQFGSTKSSYLFKDLDKELERQRMALKEDWLVEHFGQWQDFVTYKMSCGLDVIEVPSEIPIITSDNPVSIFDLKGKLNLRNPLHPENMMEVPLDRTHYLVIHPNATSDGSYQRIHRSKRDKYFAAGVNHKTEQNSDRRLIAYPGDLKTHFNSQNDLNSDNPEHFIAFMKSINETMQAAELGEIIAKHKGEIFNQAVADKVREIRKTKSMEGNPLFEELILELAKRGFFTV